MASVLDIIGIISNNQLKWSYVIKEKLAVKFYCIFEIYIKF